MLDILRRKASSWVIKVILGLIVVVFIFFFGSSTIRDQQLGNNVVAEVEGDTITQRELNGSLKLLKASNPLYASLPEQFQEQLRQSALNNLVEGEILENEALRLGLDVPRTELGHAIKDSKAAQPEGKFDLTYYQTRFRPGFYDEYGVDYEDWLQKNLLQDKVRILFGKTFAVTEPALRHQYELDNTKVKVKRIAIRADDLEASAVKTDKPADANNQKSASVPESNTQQKLVDELWPRFVKGEDLKAKLEEYKLSESEMQPTPLSKAESLLDGQFDADALATLYSLSADKPFPEKPIRVGDTVYFFKLLEKQMPSWDEFAKVQDQVRDETRDSLAAHFYQRWYQGKLDKADVEMKLD